MLLSLGLCNVLCTEGLQSSAVQSTWGTPTGEDKLGARDRILDTKVARRACAGRALGKHSPAIPQHPCGVSWCYGDAMPMIQELQPSGSRQPEPMEPMDNAMHQTLHIISYVDSLFPNAATT